MKRLAMILALAAGAGLAAGTLWAEEAQDKPKKARKKRPPRKKPGLRGAHAIMAKVCEFTDEQKKQIADINAAGAKAIKEWREANAEKMKAASENMKKAREAKDKEAMKKASAEMAALHAGQREIQKKTLSDIMALLTDEQKGKWKRYNAVRTVKGRFRSMKFTEEQEGQIAAAYEKLSAGVDLDDKKARFAMLRKLSAQVEKEILTEEQRLELAMAMIKRMYKKAELTEDQLAQIKTAYVKHMTGVDAADRKAKSAAMRKLTKEIRKDVLTDQQREAITRKRAPKPKKEG